MIENTKAKWRAVKGYESLYEVSENGDVKSIKKDKILKSCIGNLRGFTLVALSKNGKCRSFYVHKLVADAFIEKPKNAEQLIHIDCNKQNNHYSNLKYVGIGERIKYKAKNEIYPTSLAWMNIYSKKGRITVSRLFNSEMEALRNKNIGYVKTIEITDKP